MKIFFNYANISLKYIQKKKLKKAVSDLFDSEHKFVERVDYIFCTDTYLLQLNQQYLNHDTLTDIITFDLSDNKKLVAEIYISLERVIENAIIHQCSFEIELERVVFHGALHLCGYKDKTTPQKQKMTKAENKYLQLFHVKQPQKNQKGVPRETIKKKNS